MQVKGKRGLALAGDGNSMAPPFSCADGVLRPLAIIRFYMPVFLSVNDPVVAPVTQEIFTDARMLSNRSH